MTALPTTDTLLSALRPHPQPRHLYIGYSGGIDSHVLLHLAATSPLKEHVTAVYVHHGLQAVADAWAVHCSAVAHSLGVKCVVLYVNAQPTPGESPEEAARNARYAAFKALLEQDDMLMLAQHREDQLETVLLQLLRGSGVKGLSAMPTHSACGAGLLLRPLLDTAKAAIDAYAQLHALTWVTDPTNLYDDYDRNFLRNRVVPLLKQRWPQCDKTVARSAKHCAEADHLLASMAGQLLQPLYDATDQTLRISLLQTYDAPQQALVIRHWLSALGVKMPPQGLIDRIAAEVLAARPDGSPVLATTSYALRRYKDKLYCLPVAKERIQAMAWPNAQTSIALSAHRQLARIDASSGIALAHWQQAQVTIRPRSGGEKIRLPQRLGHHNLKKLFQEADIPPWEREAMPLVYLDGDLAAVGDEWISADFYSVGGACIRLSISRAACR